MVLFSLLVTPAVHALTFNVVVLPADLFRVCENYYCYPEVSEIIADDLVQYFNKSNKIHSPQISDIRLKLYQNPELKAAVKASLDKFDLRGNVDFYTMKQLSRLFSANSILLISNNVAVEESAANRNVWDILELSSNLNITYPFSMETEAVLLDTVNDLVMWSGSYSKKLNSSDGTFDAHKASESYAKYAYLQTYSQDILSKTIAQNVILRFFPKTVNPILKDNEIKPTGNFFRYESNTTPLLNKKEIVDEEPLEHEFGEMIYGI